MEFPIYVFDPAKHADQSKVREREVEEGMDVGQDAVRGSNEGLARGQQ